MFETPRPVVEDPDDADVAAGEPHRFEVLFRRYAPEIKRYAVRRLGPGPADDIVAETFLTAFRLRDSYERERGEVRAWLYGIATNLISRHKRDEIRLLKALQKTGVDPVTEPFTERVEARVSADIASRRIAAAIAGLPAGHRDVLLLVTWADLTYDQVAQSLGIPEGTVRSRMNRVRAKLRRKLGDIDPNTI
ncbi:RNA polymerase sigma factor [Actinoallomurus sp. NPDC050550]|uniref:RNA polymerase sigma factor n=1 Tax=Actinoallomurus sp. NPDC050550 TaxID=3154937 RepID=UPI0033CA5EC7